MSQALVQRLTAELDSLRLIDPHTHINPHSAASRSLADVLGYHYYTELAHSAGLPREAIEEPGLSPRDKVARLVPALTAIENTAQYAWLIEICQKFFGMTDDRLTVDNWESVFETSREVCGKQDWESTVFDRSGLDAVFLTNDFDDPLTGFDTRRYIPCLRTDDLVFHLDQQKTRDRLSSATGRSVEDSTSLTTAVGELFRKFVERGARAVAISLPPDFTPEEVSPLDFDNALTACRAGKSPTVDEKRVMAKFAFWTIATWAERYELPFDLMIGVNRRVYESGVYQGQDLFDQRTSLIQYRALFNAFPKLLFPISVLSHAANQELVSYSWIFPNVIANGHWWYSNIPVYIECDLRARLQGIPATKVIGYYSDMYKLEFAAPKFGMFRRVLAGVLATDFVLGRGWSEIRALELGRLILRGNVERVFGVV
jgi:glucuronate isomerase